MTTYEVHFHLESGYTLNVLMAAPTAEMAISEAHGVLSDASESKDVGDVMRHCWRFDAITAVPVDVRPAREA